MPGEIKKPSSRGILAPLQYLFLRRFFAETIGFYFTGGGALGEFYLGHRKSEDLDLFTGSAENLLTVDVSIGKIAADLGFENHALRSSPGFRRYLLEKDNEQIVLDVVQDTAESIEGDKPIIEGIVVDNLTEMTVNKLCTLLGRSEIKDLVDLYFIDQAGIDPMGLMEEAPRKDGGFSPATLAFVLSELKIAVLPSGMVRELAPDQLDRFRKDLIEKLTRIACPSR